MNFDEFMGKVQHRARLADTGEAVRTARVVLQNLAARVSPGERKDMAAQLPREVAYYLDQVPASETFNLQTLYDRISKDEGVDKPLAVFHANAVASVLRDALTGGEANEVIEQLPAEFRGLFEWQEQS
ncbi:MAG: DUF2267 domain-containing protein [Verrucomicrobiota bacterium]